MVQTCEPIKFLGLIVDKDLNWHGHINSAFLKLSTTIFIIPKLYYVYNVHAQEFNGANCLLFFFFFILT